MGFNNDKSTGNTSFERAPEGNYLARLIGITDIDFQPSFKWGSGAEDVSKAGYQIALTFELVAAQDGAGNNFIITKNFPFSWNELAGLYKAVKAVDPSGVHSENWTTLRDLPTDLPCSVMVGSTGKGNAKVSSVASAMAGVPVPESTRTNFKFAFEDADMEQYDLLPNFVQRDIHKGDNFPNSTLHLKMLEMGLKDPLAADAPKF